MKTKYLITVTRKNGKQLKAWYNSRVEAEDVQAKAQAMGFSVSLREYRDQAVAAPAVVKNVKCQVIIDEPRAKFVFPSFLQAEDFKRRAEARGFTAKIEVLS